MTQSSPVRLGLIGAGGFANTHMEAFSTIPDVEVVALCRRNSEALAEMQKKWDVPHGFTDYRELLAMDGLDAVDIVTPTDSHHPITLDAIAAGKHVLCDKPLALTASQCEEMLAAARQANIVHCTNFNQRGRTALGRVKRYLDNGFVGRFYHLNIWWGMSLQDSIRDVGSWRYRPETGGGTIYELIHAFDAALFLAGPVARICCIAPTAETHRTFSDVPEGMEVSVPDSSAFLIEFHSGGYAVIHTSFVSRGFDFEGGTGARFEVSGAEGRIVSDGLERLRGISGQQGLLEDLDPGEEYPQPYEQFVRDIVVGDPVRTSFEAGLEAARMVDAAMVSAREERWVAL